MSKEFNLQRYHDAAHEMQTGVAMDQQLGSQDGSPKHLRVGINSAMVDHGALVKLLIAKGVLTEEEYYQAIREGMEAEAVRYKKILSKRLGKDVELY